MHEFKIITEWNCFPVIVRREGGRALKREKIGGVGNIWRLLLTLSCTEMSYKATTRVA